MTALAIGFFACFVAALTGLLVQLFIESKNRVRTRQVTWNASSRIHDVTDLALRRMLEEALRSMGNQRLQGPMW